MSNNDLISACQVAWESGDLSSCKPLGLDAGTWMAVLGAIASILFMVVRWAASLKRTPAASEFHAQRSIGRSRFQNLCRLVKPLMDENYRIFSEFGPNSGRGDGIPKIVRNELGVWYQARETIVANNMRIRALIATNLPVIPTRYAVVFENWLNHIDAFCAHVSDASVDYRRHQFPEEASEIVKRYA
jgi:hypothetical protein